MDNQQNKKLKPAQHQSNQPGIESKMKPQPEYIQNDYKAGDKLAGKVALITGGDSGIGRAVSVHYAKEGADVAIVYLNEHDDAKETQRLVEKEGQKCLLIDGDIGNQAFCEAAVTEVLEKFNKINILINNASEQHPQDDFLDISNEQFEKTFRTNIFGTFYMTKAALSNLKQGSVIINTSSITAYEGSEDLIDYSATKGAITSFTRSLAKSVVSKGIRVNAVAPGPIWTPLIPSTFSKEKVGAFGSGTPMQRPGEPGEVAPAYVYLASDDSSYVTGQVVHINGGIVING